MLAAAGNKNVHGIAHITGGGIAENVERILPAGVQVMIDRATWSVPAPFDWVRNLGNINEAEMDRVFNMGLGMVVIVAESCAEAVLHAASNDDYPATIIGDVLAVATDSPGTVQLST